MRIRPPFAATFLALCLISAYLGFSNLQTPVNDKLLHFLTFFLLTLCFYWILEASRRRVVNFTLVICTLAGGIGSEFVQSAVNPARQFDPFDILANLTGSGLALILCTWYHRRMMERKRLAKSYQPVATADNREVENDVVDVGEELHDLEAGRQSGTLDHEAEDEQRT